MLGSLMLLTIGCLLIYGVWSHHQQQVNRELSAALIHYAKAVSSMVPAPSVVIGPAPQPWYLSLFYLGMSAFILWSIFWSLETNIQDQKTRMENRTPGPKLTRLTNGRRKRARPQSQTVGAGIKDCQSIDQIDTSSAIQVKAT